ncbi:4'-phosphopantetheinyl transferase superfamily protein [Candidatus Fermentibacterales bacterium]|nr:4'-phosphopantetheinyl transferase superfamily protein [Candidatus Fermentibacterales bacterium]
MILGVGIEIVDVPELREKLDGSFESGIFLASELDYARSLLRPWEHIAARLAAKRALWKALGASPGASMLDVEVTRRANGEVGISLHGEARRIAIEAGVAACHVSLSHTAGMAVAVVLTEGRSPGKEQD